MINLPILKAQNILYRNNFFYTLITAGLDCGRRTRNLLVNLILLMPEVSNADGRKVADIAQYYPHLELDPLLQF